MLHQYDRIIIYDPAKNKVYVDGSFSWAFDWFKSSKKSKEIIIRNNKFCSTHLKYVLRTRSSKQV